MTPCTLNFGAGSRRVVTFTLQYSLEKKSGGLHIQRACCGEEKNPPLLGLNPHFSSHPTHSLASVVSY